MARTAAARAPRAPGLLRAALPLLLLLLVAVCRRAAGAPVASELRCHCLQTSQGIHPKNIQSVQVTSPGPHCAQTQVIATLKNGQKACLNPAAPMVKRILDKMLNKTAPPDRRKQHRKQALPSRSPRVKSRIGRSQRHLDCA